MQRDLAAGHVLELDAIAGPILRGGRHHGIETPATAALVAQVDALVRARDQVETTMTSVRAAVAQVRSPQSTDDAIKRIDEVARDAAGQHVELVVFPEALLGGYPRGATFGAVIGERSAAGRDEFLAYTRQAVTLPGPELDEVASCAARHGLHMVIGFIERAGSSLYCSTVTLDDAGTVIGSRRKVMPTGSERLVWAQGDGSTLTVPRSRLGRLATAICWENLMPALRLSLYAEGVDIWCAPTADARDVQLATMRHIAIEGRCFVLAANQFAQTKRPVTSIRHHLRRPRPGGLPWRQRHREPLRGGARRASYRG